MSTAPIEEVVLEEGELRLRPPRRDEAALLAGWWSDPEVSFGFCSAPRSPEEIQQAYGELEGEARDIGHWIDFVIELSGRPVGAIWLSRWDLEAATCEMNLLFGEPQHRGRGLGRRTIRLLCRWAFPRMELRRIYLCPRDDHIPAIRCYQAAGAHLGDVREDVVFWQGETVCFRELYFDAEDFSGESTAG